MNSLALTAAAIEKPARGQAPVKRRRSGHSNRSTSVGLLKSGEGARIPFMTEFDPGTVTELLNQAGQGDAEAREKLANLIYPELLVHARKRLRKEPLLKAKDPESLVHDVLLEKLPHEKDNWQCRAEFYGYAKRAMWEVCVDEVRKILGQKRRLPTARTSTWGISPQEMLDLDKALEQLQKAFSNGTRLFQIVRHRFIEQRSVAETARILGVSDRTVESDWHFAKAWLHRELDRGDSTAVLKPVGE